MLKIHIIYILQEHNYLISFHLQTKLHKFHKSQIKWKNVGMRAEIIFNIQFYILSSLKRDKTHQRYCQNKPRHKNHLMRNISIRVLTMSFSLADLNPDI